MAGNLLFPPYLSNLKFDVPDIFQIHWRLASATFISIHCIALLALRCNRSCHRSSIDPVDRMPSSRPTNLSLAFSILNGSKARISIQCLRVG